MQNKEKHKIMHGKVSYAPILYDPVPPGQALIKFSSAERDTAANPVR